MNILQILLWKAEHFLNGLEKFFKKSYFSDDFCTYWTALIEKSEIESYNFIYNIIYYNSVI